MPQKPASATVNRTIKFLAIILPVFLLGAVEFFIFAPYSLPK
jgi:hypothetical protein